MNTQENAYYLIKSMRYVQNRKFDGAIRSPFKFTANIVIKTKSLGMRTSKAIHEIEINYMFDPNFPKLFIEQLEKENMFTEYNTQWQTFNLNTAEKILTISGKRQDSPTTYEIEIDLASSVDFKKP